MQTFKKLVEQMIQAYEPIKRTLPMEFLEAHQKSLEVQINRAFIGSTVTEGIGGPITTMDTTE